MNEAMLKALLEKAGHKSLASHFKKVAGHHEHTAGHHEKLHKAHAAMAEHHEKMKDGENGDHHKVKHQFHKSMASHHEKHAAHHTKMAEHYHKVSEAHTSEDAQKIAKAWEFELEIPAAEPAAVPAVPATPAPVATPNANGGEGNVTKTAEQKLDSLVDLLTKFVEKKAAPAAPATPEPSADPVEKKLDALIELMTKAVAPASATPTTSETAVTLTADQLAQIAAMGIVSPGRPVIKVNTPEGLKTFAVPRTGDISKAAGTETSAVPEEFQDMLKTEHID